MTCDILGPGALDYLPCRYGTSKLLFRGPKRALEGPFVAFIGGTTTFGKFVEQPYPLRVEHLTGVPSVNLGQINAGLDVFTKDPVVLGAAKAARVTVVEILGAANSSNRFFRVHPRRNDRFLRVEPLLHRLYPEVDFTQFHFTRHMLQHLFRCDPARFVSVREVLQALWMRRMRYLLSRVSKRIALVQFAGRCQIDEWQVNSQTGAALVTDEMVARLRPLVSDIVNVPQCESGKPVGDAGMAYSLLEERAARAVAGPPAHIAAAQALRPVLDRLM